MKKFFISFALLSLIFGNGVCAQSLNERIIVLGEDSEPGAVPRDHEVYGRVVSVLQNALSEAGFYAIDEQLLAAKLGLEFLTNVRRQEFIVPLQAANATDDPLIQSRLAFIFSVVPILQDMSMTRHLKVRIRGEIYDLATLRLLRSSEAVSVKPKVLPMDESICNELCVNDAVGEQARVLASQLSMDLINKINGLNAQHSTYSVFKLSLAGFDRKILLELISGLAASPEILESEVLGDRKGSRVYSVTSTKNVVQLEGLVISTLLESDIDEINIETFITPDGINVNLVSAESKEDRTNIINVEISGEDLSSSILRKLSGHLLTTFGGKRVTLKGSSNVARTFSLQTASSLLEIEEKLAGMMDGAGYDHGSYELALSEKAIKITVSNSRPTAAHGRLINLDDPAAARKVQERLKHLGLYIAEIDGVWGDGSSKALGEFKRGRGDLPNDLIWDLETQAAIF